MNKKAIAGILARLDDPEMIETVLDLIGNKADEPPAAHEAVGQLFVLDDNGRQRKRWSTAEAETAWDMMEHGYTNAEIGQRLGRTPHAVCNQLSKMREARAS